MMNNIVDNIEQCGQQHMGSKILFIAVFIRPEQVVHFLLCSCDQCQFTGQLAACDFIQSQFAASLRRGFAMSEKEPSVLCDRSKLVVIPM